MRTTVLVKSESLSLSLPLLSPFSLLSLQLKLIWYEKLFKPDLENQVQAGRENVAQYHQTTLTARQPKICFTHINNGSLEGCRLFSGGPVQLRKPSHIQRGQIYNNLPEKR